MCVGRYAAKVMRNERSEMSITEAKCLQISHNKYASQRDAISHSMGNLMLSHSAGMHNSDISIAGISKRFHFASLHCIFSAYLPTHIKFLTEFLIPRYGWGQKKSPCVVSATQGGIFDEMVRWILSPRLTSSFVFSYLPR